MKTIVLNIAILVGLIALGLILLWEKPISSNLDNCFQQDIVATNQCVSNSMGSTPYVLVQDGRYVAWSDIGFIKDFLSIGSQSIDENTEVRYQLNQPMIECLTYLLYLLLCLFSGFRLLVFVRQRKLNLRQTALILLGLALIFEGTSIIFPHLISHLTLGPWLLMAGYYVILSIFAIHYHQRIKFVRRDVFSTGFFALGALALAHIILFYQQSKIGFSTDADEAYLTIFWIHRLILTLTQLSITILFVTILNSSGWKTGHRVMGYGTIAFITGLVFAYFVSFPSAVILITALIILLLLSDMAIEEERINFLWLVVWSLALAFLVSATWYAFGAIGRVNIIHVFNYLSFSFALILAIILGIICINTWLLPHLSIAKMRWPQSLMLRHRIEFIILGTLILTFVSISGLTSLIEKNERSQRNLTNLGLIKHSDELNPQLLRALSYEINIDTFINGLELASNAENDYQFLPFSIYQHLEGNHKELLLPPFLYSIDKDEHILRIGPSESTLIDWYHTSSLSKFLNIYVFLFIIAIGLIYLLTNHIIRPLQFLGNQLYNIELGKQNRRIDWEQKDEVGQLISQYNDMLDQLDESAQVLAQSERDHAWREMAKQVAHEIKNPLTPMKLTIQHLLMRADGENSEFSEKVTRASTTLIEQIDNLTRIANDFSQFGQMPSASNDKILLNEVVTSVHDLFRKREDLDIQCRVPIDDLFVFADKDHLIRILNNIVKNAIQAIPHEQQGIILINLRREHHHALITVEDNGIGITDEQKSKVFQPNFTTKSSGTGLGLAMCSKMVESMDGRIFFETEIGKGTTFFIEIPLMRIDANYLPESI